MPTSSPGETRSSPPFAVSWPDEGVIWSDNELKAYECDGLTAYRQVPLAVVLPENTRQVSQVLEICSEHGAKVVPRGAGTSLSGGAMPLADGVLLGLGKFNRILEVDHENRCAVVQPGVSNLAISEAVADAGFYYAPDPSSQIVCTIGGNVAENSGGVHCLKYGVTTNNILGLEIVLMNGEVIRLGGRHLDPEGYDLMGVVTGSEGLLGVITEVTVRILKKPEVARAVLVGFPDIEDGGQFVADVIAAGIISRWHGDDGQTCDPCRRRILPSGLSDGCGGLGDRRARRSRHRGRPPDRTSRKHRPQMPRVFRTDQPVGRGAQRILARTQVGLRRGRTNFTGLLLHGRDYPAARTPGGLAAYRPDVGPVRSSRRQRVPRRGRESASADPL